MKYILWIALLQYIPFNFNETLGNVPMHFEYYHFAATMYLSFSYKKVSLYHMPSKTCKLSLRLSLYNVYIQRPDPSPPKLRLHFVHVPMSLLCFLKNFQAENFSKTIRLKISAQNFSSEFQAEFLSWNSESKFSAWNFSSKKQAEIFSLFFSSWNSESKFQLLAENFDSEWNFDSQMYQAQGPTLNLADQDRVGG